MALCGKPSSRSDRLPVDTTGVDVARSAVYRMCLHCRHAYLRQSAWHCRFTLSACLGYVLASMPTRHKVALAELCC